MKLQTVLNKFVNDTFLITINGLCDEIPFWEFKKMEFWKEYKNSIVKSMNLLLSNDKPELMITIIY